jgi:hypothetical protein
LLPSTATPAHRNQPGVGAEREHLAEELAEGLLVPDPEARDGGVIGDLVRADHAEATSSRQRRSIAREERSPIA